MNRKCVNFLNPKFFPNLKICASSQGTVMFPSLASFEGFKIQSSPFLTYSVYDKRFCNA